MTSNSPLFSGFSAKPRFLHVGIGAFYSKRDFFFLDHVAGLFPSFFSLGRFQIGPSPIASINRFKFPPFLATVFFSRTPPRSFPNLPQIVPYPLSPQRRQTMMAVPKIFLFPNVNPHFSACFLSTGFFFQCDQEVFDPSYWKVFFFCFGPVAPVFFLLFPSIEIQTWFQHTSHVLPFMDALLLPDLRFSTQGLPPWVYPGITS